MYRDVLRKKPHSAVLCGEGEGTTHGHTGPPTFLRQDGGGATCRKPSNRPAEAKPLPRSKAVGGLPRTGVSTSCLKQAPPENTGPDFFYGTQLSETLRACASTMT